MNDGHEMDRLLNSPDYGVTQTQGIPGILSRLYREVLKDLGMSASRFQILLTNFCITAKHELKRNNSNSKLSKYYTVGNLRRELERPQMTFKVFMKGIRILKIKEIRFTMELTHASGRKTIHGTNVKLADQDMLDSLFDDDGDNDKDGIIPMTNSLSNNERNENEFSTII